LLLVFILVVLTSFVLLNVDIFTSVREKTQIQHGGDAAAIAAANKQGQILNEIGRLNIEHLVAAARDETNECRRIVLEQRRLALLEPVEALRLANMAAKKNGMEERPEFAAILQRHINDIRTVYCAGANGAGAPYPEPFPGAWVAYAAAISSVISEGLATGPDNLEFYDSLSGHLLLNRQFYHAISGKDWCWFFFNNKNLLDDYSKYTDWAPLPVERENPLDNSEVFSLHVVSRKIAFKSVFTTEEMMELVKRYSDETLTEEEIAKSHLLADQEEPWFFFDMGSWRQWFNGLSLADDEYGYEFPIVGEIKDEYNVRGCAAVCRCVGENQTVAVESTSKFHWSAAAKPFGCVEGLDGEVAPVTAFRNFVTPAFTDVRLVPVDSVGGRDLSTADPVWSEHVRSHLPEYLVSGPGAGGGCLYCFALREWERESLRSQARRWLEFNSGSCVRTSGPGGEWGGTPHGH
jgi:hypothetical protein